MKVYLLRTATLIARGEGRFELGWKSARGSVDAKRVDDSTPFFAEMAAPGTAFDGDWRERSPGDRVKMFQASNRYAEGQIAAPSRIRRAHRHDQAWPPSSTSSPQRLAEVRASDHACLLSIGWGGGLLGKSAYLNTEDDSYRKILRQMPLYQRAIQTGMPFPKTRRVVFEGNQPASLPGWVMLEVGLS